MIYSWTSSESGSVSHAMVMNMFEHHPWKQFNNLPALKFENDSSKTELSFQLADKNGEMLFDVAYTRNKRMDSLLGVMTTRSTNRGKFSFSASKTLLAAFLADDLELLEKTIK